MHDCFYHPPVVIVKFCAKDDSRASRSLSFGSHPPCLRMVWPQTRLDRMALGQTKGGGQQKWANKSSPAIGGLDLTSSRRPYHELHTETVDVVQVKSNEN